MKLPGLLKTSMVAALTALALLAASSPALANLDSKSPPPKEPKYEDIWVDSGYFDYVFLGKRLVWGGCAMGYKQTCIFNGGECGISKYRTIPIYMPISTYEYIFEEVPVKSMRTIDVGCIHFEIPFGRPVHEKSLLPGSLFFTKDIPSPTIYSPQGLLFSLGLDTRLISVKTDNLPTGVAKQASLRGPDGVVVKYNFAAGSAVGYPAGRRTGVLTTLNMLDSSGQPVADSPAYYERREGKGASLRYSASTKECVSVTASDGRTLYMSDKSIGIEVIRDDSESLRQINSAADGLADIVVTDNFKYEIRLYAPENAGTKGSGGLYAPSGSPHTVWAIENTQRDLAKNDLIRITETRGGSSYLYDWKYVEASTQWILTEGNGMVVTSKSNVTDSTLMYLNSNTIVRNSGGDIVYNELETKYSFPWGGEVVKRVVDPDGLKLTTSRTYYTNSAETGRYGRIKSFTNPDGSWAAFDYDAQGRQTLKVEPWKDSAFNSAASSAKATYYSYSPVDSADTVADDDSRPRVVEERILGIPAGKTYFVFKEVDGSRVEITERAATPSAAYGAAGNARTVTTYYPLSANPASAGRVMKIEEADGKTTTCLYEYGIYSPSPTPGASSFTPSDDGSALRITFVNGTASSPDGVPYKTVKEVYVMDLRGNNAMSERYVYTGSGYERVSWTVSTHDVNHHVLSTVSSDNTASDAIWSCCNLQSEKDESGVEYAYSYDLMKRMVSKTKKGIGSQPDVTTSYTYDAAGRELSETVSAGGLSLSASKTYDAAGRISSKTDAQGLTTSYAYSSDGRSMTETLPGGFTKITQKYLDQRQKSVTGTASVPEYYDTGMNADGTRWTKASYATSSSPRYAKTTLDVFGRTLKTETPGWSGTVTTTNTYDSKNNLLKVSSTGKPDALYSYDELNNPYRSALDLNSNGTIDVASTDRVSETGTAFALESGDWWQVRTSKIYNDAGAAVTASTSKSRLTGLPSPSVSESVSVDIYGNASTSTTSIDRTNKTVVQTIDVPDSNIDVQTVSVNGLKTSERSKTNLTYTFSYDALGRLTGSTDPRTGASSVAYNALGQVSSATDAASNATTYAYEATTGRKSSETDALGNTTLYTYNSRGQITAIRGTAQYPIDYVYDSYGAMTQMKSYRDSSLSTPDSTTWNYNAATGLLASKTDAASRSVSYTYSTDGKLATRAWARGVTTAYAYTLAGDLASIDYSDSTPDVSFTYNRLGRPTTISDAAGTRTLSYNGYLALASEISSGLYGKTLSHSYDALGRTSSTTLDAAQMAAYSYDATGRLSGMTSGSNSLAYSFAANSDLIGSISRSNGKDTAYSYESNRNLITQVMHGADLSTYGSTNDATGRRTGVSRSGTVFANPDTLNYGYNSKSELISAQSTIDVAYAFNYTYDSIGNRVTSSERGMSSTYTTNSLNQYTLINIATPSYDYDGNMMANALGWIYTWDAENRLTTQQSESLRIECKYDYASRRVEKKVYNSNSLTKHLKFVYKGYRLVQVLDGLNSDVVLQEFTWSPDDKLQTFTDKATSTTYFVHRDANRNVTELTAADGSLGAHYEYGPYGQLLESSGPAASANPFRFSSEYHDDETGLVYYNYRYYSPSLGRWLSRDPIEEQGGLSLYAMVSNKIIFCCDYLGQEERLNRTNNKRIQDLKKLIAEEESGKTAQEIANEYDPTYGEGDRMTARNLTVDSTIGPVDIDWLLLLLNKSDDSCWLLNARDTYTIGKLYWTMMDGFLETVKNRNLETLKGHIKEFGGEEEENAIKIANEILVNNKKFGDFFPEQQKEVQVELLSKDSSHLPPPPQSNPRLRLQRSVGIL